MLTRRELEELSNFHSEQHPVVSFYIDIDKSKRGEDRYLVRLKNLCNQVEEAQERMTTGEAMSLSRDLDRIRVFVREQARQGARGVAVFASSGAGLWRTFTFPNRVGNLVEIDRIPYVKPLFRMLERYQPTCTVLVGKGKARIFLLQTDEIEEQTDVFRPVPKRHDQGGWAQARLQRHHDEQVVRHLKQTADELFERFQTGQFHRLLVGGTDELVGQFCECLHPYLKERLVGRFPMEMVASLKKVQAQSLKAVQISEEVAQARLLERLEDEVAAQNMATAGIAGTLRALERGQILTLFVNDGYSAPGYRCRSCGHLLHNPAEKCPYCSGDLEKLEDVVAYIMDTAYEQGVEIVFPAGEANRRRLAELGNIGALLRYQLQP